MRSFSKLTSNVIAISGAFLLLTSCNGQTQLSGVTILNQAEGDSVSTLDKRTMLVYQDKNNNYWFGSWDKGVYKYDGESLVNYTTEHGLPSNRIDEIKEDSVGNVYFTSCHPTSSICKYDGKSFTTLKATHSQDWKLSPNDVWFRHSFQSEKVLRYDGTKLYELQLPKPPSLDNPFEVYSIFRDRKGNVWFGTNPVGVCRYNGKSFDWITEEDVTEFRDEGANGVRSITEDKKGDFWFNTEYRYSIYDSLTLSSSNFYTRHKSIGGLDGKKDSNLDEYLSSVRDNDNNLWFVTYKNGVWKYDGKTIQQYPIQENSQLITLYSVSMDNEGDLWIGTHENGVYKFNGASFEKFEK